MGTPSEHNGPGQKPPEEEPRPEKKFTIRLRNQLNVSSGVPSQWLSVYVVHRGRVVQDFPFELSELAEARTLAFEWKPKAIETVKACSRSRLGVHLYLANARRGEADARSLDSGVFLGRFPKMPPVIELDARAMVQVFMDRLAQLREAQPSISGMLAQREFETLVRPIDPKLQVARSLEQLRRTPGPLNVPTNRIALKALNK